MQHPPHLRYSDSFKAQAVALAASIGPTQAAQELDISIESLDDWLVASRTGRPPGSPHGQPLSGSERELAQLRAENAMLKMENEILRKAEEFFAEESG